MQYVFYNPISGEVTGFGSSPELPPFISEIFLVIPDEADPFSGYVDVTTEPPVYVPKIGILVAANKTEITADGVDELVITGLPVCTARRGSLTVEVTDGELILTEDLPGNYSVTFSGVQFLPTVFNYVAV